MQQSSSAELPKQRIVSRQDLPLSCPMPDMSLWNAHPRVFLPIEKTGKATCPYCSAHYVLAE
jgi:uncharacterized Zn-finger protein